MRRRLSSPIVIRRLGLAIVLVGAILAAIATWLRDRLGVGTVARSATYYLDAASWLLAASGAVIEGWFGDLLLSTGQARTRRRAIIFAVVGLGASLIACAMIPLRSASGSGSLVRAALSGLIVGGFGLGLGGLTTIAWHFGGRYASKRIERMGEEDW